MYAVGTRTHAMTRVAEENVRCQSLPPALFETGVLLIHYCLSHTSELL